MTVVVTGAAGHIGGNLVRSLLADGRKVRVTVKKDTRALEGLELERVKADVLDPDSLRAAFDGAEVVFHLAAVISIYGDADGMVERVNIEGPRNVVNACLDAGVKRLVHFSSIHALDYRPIETPIDETRPLSLYPGALLYDRTKATGETEILAGVERGLDAVIVNPTAVIGPYDFKPSRMGEIMLDVYHRRLPGLVNAGFDWVDVRDVVRGALSAEQKGRTGERYLLGGDWAPLAVLAKTIQEVTGVKAPRFVSPMWMARMSAPFVAFFSNLLGRRPLFTPSSLRILRCHRYVSHEKAAKELGYTAQPLKETVEAFFEWYRSVGEKVGSAQDK